MPAPPSALFALAVYPTGDEKALKRWRAICAASRHEFSQIYERLGVAIEERGESFYNPMLRSVVEELKEKVGVGRVCWSARQQHVFTMTQ